MQCKNVSPNDAAELFEDTDDCFGGTADLSQAILDLDAEETLDNKILPVVDLKCDSDSACHAEKKKAEAALKTSENELISTRDSLAKIGGFLNEFKDAVLEQREQTYSHETVSTKLRQKVDRFFPPDSTDKEEISTRKKLLEGVENAIGFGTTDTYQNIIAATEQEITIAKDNYEKSKNKVGVMKTYKNKVIRGLKIMSNTDRIAKASKAVGGIVAAIGKFQSNDALTIVSGVADVVSTLMDFLPPPASIVGGMLQLITLIEVLKVICLFFLRCYKLNH